MIGVVGVGKYMYDICVCVCCWKFRKSLLGTNDPDFPSYTNSGFMHKCKRCILIRNNTTQ